jgi:aminocarboxymuconate-semialdehyde decarboxylase
MRTSKPKTGKRKAVSKQARKTAAPMRKVKKAGKPISTRVSGRISRKSKTATPAKRTFRAPRPFVIDFHAHFAIPEVAAFTAQAYGTVDSSIPADTPEHLAAESREWAANNAHKMRDFDARLKDMDSMGVDMQVLTSSIIRSCTWWADAETGLKWDRLINERVAEAVAKKPDRFVGLGSVPLQAPELAVRELQYCMGELGLKGVQLSTHVYGMELGDARLDPFWAAAQKSNAALFLHPAGTIDARYARHQLWNSIGQSIEEAMGMASLWYEGVLDRFPKLKLCVAHGGGFLPFYAGRVDRNYIEKAFTRVNMKKSPSEYMQDHFWYDTCMYNPEMMDYLAKKVGPSRIVCGSDYPVGDPDPVAYVKRTKGISSADKAAILGGNAAQLLGLSI